MIEFNVLLSVKPSSYYLCQVEANMHIVYCVSRLCVC